MVTITDTWDRSNLLEISSSEDTILSKLAGVLSLGTLRSHISALLGYMSLLRWDLMRLQVFCIVTLFADLKCPRNCSPEGKCFLLEWTEVSNMMWLLGQPCFYFVSKKSFFRIHGKLDSFLQQINLDLFYLKSDYWLHLNHSQSLSLWNQQHQSNMLDGALHRHLLHTKLGIIWRNNSFIHPSSRVQRLLGSMSRSIEAVLAAHGGPKPYQPCYYCLWLAFNLLFTVISYLSI